VKKFLIVAIVLVSNISNAGQDHTGMYSDDKTKVLLTDLWIENLHGYFANYRIKETASHWPHDHSYTIDGDVVTLRCWRNVANHLPMKKEGEASFNLVDGGNGLEIENAYLPKVSNDDNVPGKVRF
jgi:hypothetical protein